MQHVRQRKEGDSSAARLVRLATGTRPYKIASTSYHHHFASGCDVFISVLVAVYMDNGFFSQLLLMPFSAPFGPPRYKTLSCRSLRKMDGKAILSSYLSWGRTLVITYLVINVEGSEMNGYNGQSGDKEKRPWFLFVLLSCHDNKIKGEGSKWAA